MELPADLRLRIADKVASGAYRSEEEVLSEGLRLLELRDQRLAALQTDVQEGLDSIDQGAVRDAYEVLNELRQNLPK